jgi:hypothetical protein
MIYKSDRIIDGRRRKVIVEDGKIINKEPSKEELKSVEVEPYIKNRKLYTDGELLELLVQFYKDTGIVPTSADFGSSPKYPSIETYRKRFGGWNRAIEIAGLWDNHIKRQLYTDEELLEFLRQFYKENNKIPMMRDFANSNKYPDPGTYQIRFGSWENARRMVGLDVDTMVRNGFLECSMHKARLFEIFVLEHFSTEDAIDLSGDNCGSFADGICPNGKIYDAKSSKLHDGGYWLFITNNEYKEEIEYYYFGAFNEDFTELEHVWRVPKKIV